MIFFASFRVKQKFLSMKSLALTKLFPWDDYIHRLTTFPLNKLVKECDLAVCIILCHLTLTEALRFKLVNKKASEIVKRYKIVLYAECTFTITVWRRNWFRLPMCGGPIFVS